MFRYYLCPLGHRIPPADLIKPTELEDRLLPGEPMPLGECPDCGELVSVDQEGELEREAVNDSFVGEE